MSTRTAEATPLHFGREQPYQFDSFESFFESEYAPETGRVIHVGCGDGRLSVYLARCGWYVLGIDPDRDLLAAARERAHMANVPIDLMAGDPLLLPPIPEESFGLAVDLSTAGSLADGLEREEFLRRMFKLLRRGGVLISSAPAPKPRKGRKTKAKNRPYAFAGPFVSDFTRAGFEVRFEGVQTSPDGESRLMVHARKPG